MAHKTNILITGATGYIGGSVLLRFLNHPQAASFDITCVVRSVEKAGKLKSLGVNAIVGSHSDVPLMEKLASQSDVVVAMADADNLVAARATLKGLKARHASTGTVPVLIHTSGVGCLMDEARGMYASDTIYYDSNADQMESISPTAMHRDVDTELIDADKQGYVKVHIVIPASVFGIATGKLVELGIQHAHSIMIPMLTQIGLVRGEVGMIGQGKNIMPNVHIDDAADLYIVLYDAIQSGGTVGHGREGHYFAENDEGALYDASKAIAQALVDLGKIKNPEPTTFSKEEIHSYLRGYEGLGANDRCRGIQARSLGWKPTKTTDDMIAGIKQDVESLVTQK